MSDNERDFPVFVFILGLMFWIFILLGLYYLITRITGWPFPAREISIFTLIVLIISLVAAISPGARKKFEKITPKGKATITIVIGIPLVLLLVGSVIFLPLEYQVAGLRAIFILAAVMFPPAMYYLFIASRKYGLFNEFIASLKRLGTLRTNFDEITYLQKFQGVYGPFPPEVKEEINKAKEEGPIKIINSKNIFTAEIFSPEATFPVFFATLLLALGWLIILPPWQPDNIIQEWKEALMPEQTPVNFAFLGAYFFSVQMLFRRYIQQDLRSSAYVSVSLRIFLALIGIWIVEAMLSSNYEQLLILGFVIGAFPQIAWQLITTYAKKFAGLAVPEFKTPLPLHELDGITIWNEARLSEEDIENIPNMATANLVDLILRTRISPDRIIDWVDQAILYTHLGADKEGKETRKKLRSYGIRTATSLMKSEESIPEWGSDKMQSFKTSITCNPNLALIQKWNDSTPAV